MPFPFAGAAGAPAARISAERGRRRIFASSRCRRRPSSPTYELEMDEPDLELLGVESASDKDLLKLALVTITESGDDGQSLCADYCKYQKLTCGAGDLAEPALFAPSPAGRSVGTSMLVIRRRAGQCIRIGDEIEIHVAEISPTKVTIGIRAPREVSVTRSEHTLTKQQNLAAADSLRPMLWQGSRRTSPCRLSFPPYRAPWLSTGRARPGCRAALLRRSQTGSTKSRRFASAWGCFIWIVGSRSLPRG